MPRSRKELVRIGFFIDTGMLIADDEYNELSKEKRDFYVDVAVNNGVSAEYDSANLGENLFPIKHQVTSGNSKNKKIVKNDIVRHKVFGEGKVVSSSGETVHVQFKDSPELRHLNIAYAPMVKLNKKSEEEHKKIEDEHEILKELKELRSREAKKSARRDSVKLWVGLILGIFLWTATSGVPVFDIIPNPFVNEEVASNSENNCRGTAPVYTSPFDLKTYNYRCGEDGIWKYTDRFNDPDCNLIKGNIAFDSKERIYHVKGQKYYDDTRINLEYGERFFCSEQEAISAGWRKSFE